MRLLPTFLVLFYWLIWASNGAPPRQVNKHSSSGTPYTEEEDQLIVSELLNILDGTVNLHIKKVWEKVAEKHYEKYHQGDIGFPRERPAVALRSHFNELVVHNKPHPTVTIPEALIKQYKEEVIRQPYTKEEDNFIVEELSKPSYTHLYSSSTLNALCAEHAKKHKARTAGFKNARTAESLRKHLTAMHHAGQFPEEVLGKLRRRSRGASSSQPSTSNQQAGVQVTNEGESDNDWVADMIEELQNTDYEVDFSKLE